MDQIVWQPVRAEGPVRVYGITRLDVLRIEEALNGIRDLEVPGLSNEAAAKIIEYVDTIAETLTRLPAMDTRAMESRVEAAERQSANRLQVIGEWEAYCADQKRYIDRLKAGLQPAAPSPDWKEPSR